MHEKYEATICGDRIEWKSDTPASVGKEDRIDVIVELPKKPLKQSRADRHRAVAALQAIADRGGIKSIPDPDKWLREIRRDRRLPGR